MRTRARGLARSVLRGLFVHHAFDHAATMSFYFFLGIIPLLILGGMIVGKVVHATGVATLASPLYRVLPGIAGELLKRELHRLASVQPGSVAPLSALGFLWLTSNGFHNLMDVFELLLGVHPPRPWWKQRIIAIAWVAAVLAIVVLFVSLVLTTNGVFEGLNGRTDLPKILSRTRDAAAQGWNRAGVLVLFAVVSSTGLAAFYRVAVEHPVGVRRRVWPGTLVAIALWFLVSWAFGAYVRTIGDYALYYGSLATVAVTLLWLYLSSLSFLIGAEVNAQLEGVRDEEEGPYSARSHPPRASRAP